MGPGAPAPGCASPRLRSDLRSPTTIAEGLSAPPAAAGERSEGKPGRTRGAAAPPLCSKSSEGGRARDSGETLTRVTRHHAESANASSYVGAVPVKPTRHHRKPIHGRI